MQTLFPYLPLAVARLLVGIPDPVADKLTEIRLRLHGPLSVTSGGKSYFVSAGGRLCGISDAYICTDDDLSTCLSLLTKGSLYSYGDAIAGGYIPFADGCRAGISGDVRVCEGKSCGMFPISGINLRRSRFFPKYGEKAVRHIRAEGLRGALVYSPPCKGKTSLLRSIAYLLSQSYTVAIADERAELFVPPMALGLTDRITGVKKSTAMPMLCRSMSPRFMICDELSEEDENAVLDAVGTGVCIIASAHGDSAEGVAARPFMGRLLRKNAFPLLIGIGEDFEYRVEEYKRCTA